MDKKRAVVLAFALLLIAGAASADSGISIDAVGMHGDALSIGITSEDYELSNARVKAFIPELGIMAPAKNIDLREDGSRTMLMLIDDEIPEGEYLVRISVRDGSKRKIAHRYLSVE